MQMFEIILSYVSALCTIPGARAGAGSAAADHGWRNNSVHQSIWRAADMDTSLSRFKV